MRTPKALSAVLALIASLTLTGCDTTTDIPDIQHIDSAIQQAQDGLDKLTEQFEDMLGQFDSAADTPTTSSTTGDGLDLQWNINDYPDYYTVSGTADFTGDTIPAAGTIAYGTPDQLGRSTAAIGVITKQLRDSGNERDRDMPDEITGWPDNNPKVGIDLGDGDTYHGYLFNRSHLIAKSLGGEDAPENMVTGTRTQNVGRNQPAGGMAYAETLARNWLDANPDGTITYKATPHYTGSELLPRTVTVDILSSDKSIDQHVIVFNTANGYDIDYQNGGTR